MLKLYKVAGLSVEILSLLRINSVSMPMVSIEAIGIAIYDEKVGDVLKSICLEIEKKYQIQFLEITTDKGHVHCLVQSLTT